MPRHPVQPPEWIDAAPIQASASVEISATPHEVWRHVIDHESWPTWFIKLDRVELLGSPTGVGGGRRVFAGRLPVDEEFTAWLDDAHFAFAVVATKVPILHTLAESVRLEPSHAGTLVTYRQGLQARQGFGWAMRLAWKSMAASLEPSLDNLKRRIESQNGARS